MNASKKLSHATCLLAMTGLLYGCGTEEPPPSTISTTFSGAVQQGPIANATVFLDSNNNGAFDPGEPITTTSATGTYTLTLTPAQTAAVQPGDKIIVLFNGNSIDTITGAVPTGILVADAPTGIGSIPNASTTNVTPFTTLQSFAPTAQAKADLAAKLASLGLATPNDLPSSSSPAIIALAKSVETIISAIQASIATKNGPAATKVAQDVAASLAVAIANLPAGTLTPAIIATALSNTAATTVAAETGVFTVPPTAAQINNVLIPAVTAVVTTVQIGAGGILTTTPAANEESTIITTANTLGAPSIASTTAAASASLTTVIAPLVLPVPPTVISTSNTLTTSSLVPAISVRFSENVLNANATNITLANAATGAAVAGTVTYNPTTFIATFTPNAPLTAGATYTLTVSTGITNQAGTALAANVTFTVIVASNATGATGGTGGSTGGTGINF
jgi:hypothetical protein